MVSDARPDSAVLPAPAMRPAVWRAIAILPLALLGSETYEYVYRFRAGTYFDYGALRGPASTVWLLFWIAATAGLGIAGGILLAQRRNLSAKAYTVALLPAAALILPALYPGRLFGTVLYVAVLSLILYRILARAGGVPKPPMPTSRTVVALLLCAGLAMTVLGALFQEKLLNLLSLGYADFCIYWNVLHNTCRGRWFYNAGVAQSYNADHFMPAGFLLMAPFYKLFPRRETIFVLCTASLFLPCLVVYALARRMTRSLAWGAIFATLYLLYPSLSRMTTAGTYGFHVVYLAIPLIFLAMYFYESGKPWRAAALAVTAILVKETVAVTFAGIGVALVLTGRRRTGALVACFCCAYFLLITRVVMPGFSADATYLHLGRFSHLGASPLELLLSPVVRWEVFWPCLLRRHVLYYIALLLLPLGFLPLWKPRLVLAVVPLLLFTALQRNPERVSLNVQYQASLIPILFYAAIAAVGDRESRSRYAAALAWPDAPRAGAEANALAVLLLAAGLLSSHTFGQTFYARQNIVPLLLARDYADDIAAVKKHIPPGTTLSASQRLAAHFEVRNQISQRSLATFQTEYYLLDLDDPYSRSESFHRDRYRAEMELGYYPIRTFPIGTRTVVLYAKRGKRLTPDAWEQLPGDARSTPVEHEAIRLHGWKFSGTGSKGNVRLKLYFEVLRRDNADYRVELYAVQPDGAHRLVGDRLFCNGLRPVYACRAGERLIHEAEAIDCEAGESILIGFRTVFRAAQAKTRKP